MNFCELLESLHQSWNRNRPKPCMRKFIAQAGHVAFKDEGGVTSVDFNVGKSGRSELKVTGKCKRNARHFESSTTLCRVCTNDAFYKVSKMKNLLRRNHHHLPNLDFRCILFCKTLTASATGTHGGFSVLRRHADESLPQLDMSRQPPTQELVAKDLHGTKWRFRHIFRGLWKKENESDTDMKKRKNHVCDREILLKKKAKKTVMNENKKDIYGHKEFHTTIVIDAQHEAPVSVKKACIPNTVCVMFYGYSKRGTRVISFSIQPRVKDGMIFSFFGVFRKVSGTDSIIWMEAR